MIKEQIKSRKRVADHGEVFTSEREVSAMLNLVKHETERIDSRFLEPACGNGNFLVPILERKIALIRSKYAKSKLEFERYSVVAVGSVYGVDILEDNIIHCRERLYDVVNSTYTALYKDECKEQFRDVVRFVLSKNMLWGDALTLKTVGENPEPIVFSEWASVTGSMIKRRDFTFADLISKESANVGLFAGLRKTEKGDMPFFIPEPVKEFPLCNFLEVHYEKTN